MRATVFKKSGAYVGIGAFIIVWWSLAFTYESQRALDPPAEITTISSPQPPLISILDRNQLHQALNGDIELMGALINAWDLDAELLQKQGIAEIQRLSPEEYSKARLLLRQLQMGQEASPSISSIVDDNGISFDLMQRREKFLPQTYVSASILLSLLPSHQIVALPKGLREQKQLFLPEKLEEIPLDTDRFNAEELHLAAPQVAFVAHYSHPATLEALKHQGVKLFFTNSINSLEEIIAIPTTLGHIVGQSCRGELLSLFLKASLYAIDNHWKTFRESNEIKLRQVLYLSRYSRFSTPTRQSLVGQLLRRLDVEPLATHSNFVQQSGIWSIPLSQEELIALNPDCLILASTPEHHLADEILSNPCLDSIEAVRQWRLFVVDEPLMESPSQFIILAYYDLYHALTSAHLQ